jgi:hypothetical protein
MAEQRITIDSVLGGVAKSAYFAQKDQYQAAIGIDPDLPIDESTVRYEGFLRPTSMAKFSATEITGVPLWFVTNPKTTDTYLYANDGKVHTVASNLTMGTALNSGSALSSSGGNGAEYYDNYAYFVKNTDIARYGPLNGAPSLSQTYWTSTLGKTALTDTTYPTINGVELPNHPMYVHPGNNKAYIGDVVSNVGVLHLLATTKTTVEGDTDNGSTYNALDTYYGWYPTTICHYGTEVVVGLIEGTDTTVKQKNAKIIFWDTTATTYGLFIDKELPDTLVTATRNVNGQLYVFTGNATGGCRVLRYAGGHTFEEMYYDSDAYPPLPGAVDALLNRVLWGGNVTDPASAAVVKSLGSKQTGFMSQRAMHVPYRATSSNTTNQSVTAIKFIQQPTFLKPIPVIGWSDNAAKGLDKPSTTYQTSYWQSRVFKIGRPFQIKSVTIPLAQAVATNMTIAMNIYVDDASTSIPLATINSTNYSGSERLIKDTTDAVRGYSNFFLELVWSGTALATVGLPITIIVDIEEDGTN